MLSDVHFFFQIRLHICKVCLHCFSMHMDWISRAYKFLLVGTGSCVIQTDTYRLTGSFFKFIIMGGLGTLNLTSCLFQVSSSNGIASGNFSYCWQLIFIIMQYKCKNLLEKLENTYSESKKPNECLDGLRFEYEMLQTDKTEQMTGQLLKYYECTCFLHKY